MKDLFVFGWPALIFPVLAMIAFAIFVPRLLALLLPEGVPYLLVIGALSCCICLLLSGLIFVGLYAAQNTQVMMAVVRTVGITHFLKLGGGASIVWAPVLLLSVSNLPRHWKEATW